MKRLVVIFLVSGLSIPGRHEFIDAGEVEIKKPPTAGYATGSGSFRLKEESGEGLYIRPRDGQMFKAKLTFDSLNDHVWWYREAGTSFYLGFAVHPDCGCGWLRPIYWGFWDTNGRWHLYSLGLGHKVRLGNPDEPMATPRPKTSEPDAAEIVFTQVRPAASATRGVAGSSQKSTGSSDLRGRIEVTLPANAQVKIHGQSTTSTGSQRSYTSPPLHPGQDYYYEVTVEVNHEGGLVTESRRVLIRAGQATRVHFELLGRQLIAVRK